MNIFLVTGRPGGGLNCGSTEAQLARLLPELPQRRPATVSSWLAPSGRVGLVCAAHDPALLGGVSYVHLESQRFSLFTGRPFSWTGEEQADGNAALDPRRYLAPARDWAESLD